MKVWLTKYALTQGVTVREDATGDADTPNMIGYPAMCGGTVYCHKPHWHTTEADAKARAEVMRQKAIKSHEKAIAKMKAMRF